MAKKKHVKVPDPSPGDPARPEGSTDATPGIAVDSDVERGDASPVPAIASVETADPATARVDIEHGAASDTGDVERGPAGQF